MTDKTERIMNHAIKSVLNRSTWMKFPIVENGVRLQVMVSRVPEKGEDGLYRIPYGSLPSVRG